MADVQIEVENEQENVDENVDENVNEQVKVYDQDGVHETPKFNFSNKNVKELSKEEREKLIEDSKNGIDNEFFKVVKDKNGRTSIRKKSMSKSRQLINEQAQNDNTNVKNESGKRFLTNEQLLMEHIIDLQSKFEVMRMKHKKLKSKYNSLENDIYADDEINAKPVNEIDEPEPKQQTGFQPSGQSPPQQPQRVHKRTKSNWRNMVSYLN